LRSSGVNALLVEAMSADIFLIPARRLITLPISGKFARPRQG
jgi:hypothetical protein